jgi:hypothetical protein
VAKGVDIEMAPLDEDHVRAKITWSEQDVGGGKLVVEVTVKNMKTRPKTDDQLRSDARALAVRFARAFADIRLRISAARPWCTQLAMSPDGLHARWSSSMLSMLVRVQSNVDSRSLSTLLCVTK